MSVNKASFWYPDFVETSAWLDHAPFAFWITSVLRPRSFVELGTHGGYSYFAFCQAVKALGLDARCYAVDTWKGDEHAGFYGEEIFQRVRDYNEAHYAAFSHLVRSSFDEALANFSDASVDLLHIDGRHFYEDVKHDFESWRPKLSEHAVVLFHDTNVRERNFGVFRLWEELQAEFRTFEFLHGHGLGVLGYGAALPAEIKAFFDATSDTRAATEARMAYARLGAAIKADFTQRQAQAQLTAKLETRDAEAIDLASRLQVQEARAGELEAKLEAREARIRETEALHEAQAADIRSRDAEIVRLRDERAASAAEMARLKGERAKANAAAAARRAQITEIQSSRSWRITAPMRAVSTGLRWLLRHAHRALEPMRQLGTEQAKRAANASLSYYQRFVPVPVREMIPERVRNAVKRRLRARGLPVPEYAEPFLNETVVEAEAAFRAKDWPAAAARWQAVLDGSASNELAASRARLNISVARRLTHIDTYKRHTAEYGRARAEKTRHRNAGRKIVIYTAISGNYDSIKLPETPDLRFDYFLFTDAPAPDTGLYQVRPVTCFHEDKTRAARFVKTHPHMLLGDYDIAIWIDASIMIVGDIGPLVEEFLGSGKAVAAIPHPFRKSVHEELDACIRQRKDDARTMQEQLSQYRSKGFDNDDLIESNLMMFDLRNESTRPFLDAWWAEIDRFSKRDQLSLNHALKQTGVEWHRLTEHPNSVRNHPMFAFVLHDAGDGPANRLIDALQAPVVDPYAGPSYAEVRDRRIAAQKHRRIDIVVCVHNAPEDVKLCLESVRRARTSDRQKLIVIDDGSKQTTARYLEEFASNAPWIELHRNEQARGYTKAANQGLAASTGELVILLNSDTIVTDGWVEKMADAVFSTPGAGIVGPMSNAASHQSIPEHRSSNGQTAVNELPPGLTAEDLNRHCERWTVADLLPRVPLVHGFCFGVTREVIERIGFFDEDNFPRGYGEENDYCFRATDAGFGLVVATHTYVFHAKSKSYAGPERMAQMKAGSEALKRLRGSARIQRAVRGMQENPIFVSLRKRARSLTESALNAVSKTHSDHEYYAPSAGVELNRYIAQGNKQGVHHAIRYVWAIEAIKDMPSISRILDYGCGEGYGANAIAQAFPDIQVVAIDYDPEAIATAKEKYRRPNLRFMTGDTRQHHPALGDSTFDLAVSFDVLEHVEHRELFFSNLTRYLKPDGQVFLSTPCGGRRPVRANPSWAHHKIEYNASALYDVLRRYFSNVLRIDDAASAFPARHVFNRLDGGSVSYLNILNPVICRGPIKIEDPYAEYLSGIKASVAFTPIEDGNERQRGSKQLTSNDDTNRPFEGAATLQETLFPSGRASAVSGTSSILAIIPLRSNGHPEGSGFIRVVRPLRHISLSRVLKLSLANGGWEELGKDHNALLIQRDAIRLPKQARRLVERCRKKKIRLIYEIDDDLLHLPDTHPTAARFSPAVKEAMQTIARHADAVVVSTAPLKERMTAINRNVLVVPNALDERLWHPGDAFRRSADRSGRVGILFMGTRTHDDDLALIADPIRRLKERYGERVTFTCIGAFAQKPPEAAAVESVPEFADTYPEFAQWMARSCRYDIAVAPLVENEFNRHKSYIKYLDYAICGIAPVMSDIAPYRDVVRHRETGLLAKNDPDSWYESLCDLIEDPALRDKIGRTAQEDVLAHHTLAAQAEERRRIWSEILC